MRVYVTGAGGQLGQDVMAELARRGHEAVGTRVDITKGEETRAFLSSQRPEAVIHCAAWTDVDGAESHREACYAVNAEGTRHVTEACRAVGAKLLYLSTDYVFPGTGDEPWRPEDPVGPLNYYGRTKLEGERAVQEWEKSFIVRTAWVFGRQGKNFVKTMLNVGRSHEEVRVVMDQVGTPTYTEDLARLLVDMAESEKYGIYHATNEGGYISWYEFCREIYRQAGLSTRVLPVTTAEYGLSVAVRPENSRLDKSKLAQNGFEPLPDWRNALHKCVTGTWCHGDGYIDTGEPSPTDFN